MTHRERRRDESGVTLVEVMISMILLAIIVTAVDSSITVIEKQQVQVSNRTQALDYIQMAQQAITRDIHAAQTWNTPAVPTSTPSAPITATTLNFTASLNGATPTINISLSATTHILAITCTGSSIGCRGNTLQIANVDPSTLFTLSTSEVTNSATSPATNTFYYTSIASVVTVDTPKVGAQNVSQTTLTEPTLVPFNILYSCQTALLGEGTSGSC
jgi:prepilin-type N-terminal cleavage/methylation domain-containing protein